MPETESALPAAMASEPWICDAPAVRLSEPAARFSPRSQRKVRIITSPEFSVTTPFEPEMMTTLVEFGSRLSLQFRASLQEEPSPPPSQ